jgi:CubicO group peptidase (beta-lactamase class C family)
MAQFGIEADPASVGMDPGRLWRIDSHFARYVDDGRLPGWLCAIARHGKLAYLSCYGWRDRERALPVEDSTLWRFASMTKPVTTVAALMLYEQGAFELKDPVSRWIPAFADAKVYRAGSLGTVDVRPAVEQVRIWHLMTHTAGLTYGFHHANAVDAMYRAAGFEWGAPEGADLQACCDVWASLPLLFEPGTEFNYSVATDVLGRLVEVWSGCPLDSFLRDRIFEPLGMHDTGFWVPETAAERLAALYACSPSGPDQPAVPIDGSAALSRPKVLSGGGGLIGSAADYLRFAEMLRLGGSYQGVRLLSPRTVRYMATNHLPGGADLERVGRRLFAETTFDGVGFGLGVSVVTDPTAGKVLTSLGEFGWGGSYSTAFLIAPQEELTVAFFTQLLPSSTHPLRSQLRQLVYQALVD